MLAWFPVHVHLHIVAIRCFLGGMFREQPHEHECEHIDSDTKNGYGMVCRAAFNLLCASGTGGPRGFANRGENPQARNHQTREKNMITQWCSDRNCSNEYLVLQNHKRSRGALQEVPKAIRRINSWLCVRGRLTLPHQWHKFKTPRSPRSHEGAKPTSPKSWNPNTHVLHAYTNGPKQTRTHLKNCATGLTSDLVF